MTSNIIASNKQSHLFRALQATSGSEKTAVEEYYSYDTKMAYPNSAVNRWFSQSPRGSVNAALTGSVSFDVLKNGLLSEMFVRLSFTATAGADVNDATATAQFKKPLGANLIRSITLKTGRSHNLIYLSGQALLDKVQAFTKESKALQERMSLINPATGEPWTGAFAAAGPRAVHTYIPILGFFSDRLKNSLMTTELEDLTLVIEFNSVADRGFNYTLSAADAQLYSKYHELEQMAYSALKEMTFGGKGALHYLGWSSVTETKVCTSTTNNFIPIRTTVPCFAQSLSVVLNTATGERARFRIGSYDYVINSMKFEESIPLLIGNHEVEKVFGRELIDGARNTLPPLTLAHCLDIGDWSSHSGQISFQHLDQPTINIYHGTLGTAGNYTMHLTSYYFQELIVSPDRSIMVASQT